MNLHILKCIIYRFEQATNNVLTKKCFSFKKGLKNYNKYNGVIPMKTHNVESMHPKVLATKML
jgi:hypothetical protein